MQPETSGIEFKNRGLPRHETLKSFDETTDLFPGPVSNVFRNDEGGEETYYELFNVSRNEKINQEY